ncbi:MAG: ParB/RepB/Spo0J family partition protein [Patescibacteria group bacterium]|jgi:ParB family chromosome partitioning protein
MVANNSSLGRGLSSLIPQKNNNPEPENEQILEEGNDVQIEGGRVISQPQAGDSLAYVSISLIDANPMQPRSRFELSSLEELENSIKQHGILQPIVVTKKSDGRYEIIVGERRFRAAKRAMLKEVPVIIREADRQEKLELALIENIVREDLNPVELAEAYERYIKEFELTHEEAAHRMGKSRSAISNSIRILTLPEEIKEAMREGRLSDAHAKVIVGLDTEEKQLNLFRRVVERGLSVSRTRLETQKMGGTRGARIKIDARDEELEKKLRQYLGTRVKVERAGYKGKIIIEFFNYDELVELANKILREDE